MSIVELIKYIFLGIVQGLTEILPISSSGHIVVLSEIFNLETDSGYFLSTLLNLGSFVVIVIFFRKMIGNFIANFVRYVFKKDRSEEVVNGFKYFIAFVIASIPVGIVGLIFYRNIGAYTGNYMMITGIGFFVTASILYINRNRVNHYTSTVITQRDGLIIGLLQPISLVPGLSRLAMTTCAGLYRKKSMETSLTFSILLYLPISFGQLILSLNGLINNPHVLEVPTHTFIYYFAAFTASVIFTYFALKWIFIWVRKGSFNYFALYNFVVGMLAFIFGLAMQ